MTSRQIHTTTTATAIIIAAIAAAPSASLIHIAGIAFFLAVGVFAFAIVADGLLTAAEIVFG